MPFRLIPFIRRWIRSRNEIQTGAKIGAANNITGSAIGGTAVVGAGCQINDSRLVGSVVIGDENFLDDAKLTGFVTVGRGCRIYGCEAGGNVIIGDFTSLWGPNLHISSNSIYQVEIGKFCSVGRSVSIQAFNHNYKKATTYFIGKNVFNERWNDERTGKGHIRIGNDVWVGAHSMVLTGVTIGHGALIAANSVVTTDVPPYAIVAGSPAKVIAYRFSAEIIEKMLELKWWDWPLVKIKSNKDFFQDDISIESINRLLTNA